MPYFDHPELPSAPSDESVLWRYLSLTELIDLLNSNALHLTRADQLMDLSIDAESQVILGASSGLSAESVRRSFALMRSVQSAVFLDCWYQNGSAKHGEWEASGAINEGVAIRSNAHALKTSLAQAPQKIYASSVQYIDFTTDPMPTGNIFLPALHKRRDLRLEKEVRILLLQTSGENKFSPGPAGGLNIPVDTKTLIQSLHIAPGSADSFRNRVVSLAGDYGLTYESSTTELASALHPAELLRSDNLVE